MRKPIIQGEGKGGGSRRNPVDHPNTLQARSTARLIDLLSEGPIFGLVRQDALERSIYMDDTPIANADGSLNYEGVTVYERKGDADQDVMPGFSQVETEQSANFSLEKSNSPYSITISSSTVKQVRVKVRLSGLFKQNTGNGDVEPTFVKLRIEVGSSGSSGSSAIDELPLSGGVGSVTITEGGSGYTGGTPTVSFSGGGGSGATGTVTVSGGVITGVTITHTGWDYYEAPLVSFATVGAFDVEATADANFSSFASAAFGGTDYTSAPAVVFHGGGSAGSGAAATATITEGVVTGVSVDSGGTGYDAGTAAVFFRGGAGTIAKGTVTVSGGAITAVAIDSGGSAYTFAPGVVFTGAAPTSAATAVAEISGGKVTGLFLTTSVQGVKMINGGSGYTDTATVTFSGGGGAGATGTPIFHTDPDQIAGVTITNAGSGYTSAPTVTFADASHAYPTWWNTDTARRVQVPDPVAVGVAQGKLAGGSGYDSAPVAELTGGGGDGAQAAARVSPYHIYGGEITISGKTVGAYEESYLIDIEEFSERLKEAGLAAATYPITIQIYRLTEDREAATVTDQTTVSGYTEIQPYNVSYADSALVGLVLDAHKFGGNIPRRSFDVKGRLIRVPDGYTGDVEFGTPRTYPAFWDGVFQTKWSDNPAWVLLDILTNERYGLGLEDSDIDVYALYAVAKYCDELVSTKTINSEGITEERQECRYTCNVVINSRREAYQVLQALASTFRGMVFASASGVGFSQDRPKDPVRLVSPADVIDGSFTYSSTAKKARHSCALITWNDPDDNYEQAVEVYEDLDLIDRYGYNPIEVVAYATTSQTQARRMGKWILDSEKSETDTVTFQGGLDFLDLGPGDIIAVADPMKQDARLGGRIVSYDFLSLTPSGTADETIAAAGTIAHGDMSLTSDAVFECTVKLAEDIQPTGCIWEVGNSTLGAYLGFNDDGDLVARAGYGGADLAGNVNELARLVIANSKLPVGRELKILVGIEVGTASTAGRIRVWQNSQFAGEATTGDGSSLSSGWSAASDGKYGGKSGVSDIVLGETGDYDDDTNATLVSSLSYWAGSAAKVLHLLANFAIDDEVQSGAAITSESDSTYSSAANSVQHDIGATFECSIKMPSSGLPTGLVCELGNGSTTDDEGMYVGFDAAGDLIFHVGSGGATPDASDSCQIRVPTSYFSNGEAYHLMWACVPSTGRMGVWLNWEYFSSTTTDDSSALANSRFADTENGGYGLLSSNTLTGQVTSVFNGTFSTPLRYYNQDSQTGGLTTLLSVSRSTNYGTITLDEGYSTQTGDRVMFMTREMKIDNLVIQSGTTGSEITLLEYPTGTPVTNAMYVIQAAAANAKEYRILSTREVEPSRYEVSALEYDATKFDRIEKDLIVDRPSTSLFPTGPVTPPPISDDETGVIITVHESLYRTKSDIQTRIDLSCLPSPDARVNLYEWSFRRPGSTEADGSRNSDWESFPSTSSTSVTILNADPGKWDFRVVATAGGTKSTASAPVERLDYEIFGKTLPPEDVTGFLALRGFSKVTLKWDAVSDLDLRDYAIYQGANWPGDELPNDDLVFVDGTEAMIEVSTSATVTFWIKARDTSGNFSLAAVSISASPATLAAVTNLSVFQRFNDDSLYSADVDLMWDATDVRNEVVAYEVRTTSELDDEEEGGHWDDLQTASETVAPKSSVKVALKDATAAIHEFKVRPYIKLEEGPRYYGVEASAQLELFPGNGTLRKVQNEHTTWTGVSSNEARAFIDSGVVATQTTPKNTVIHNSEDTNAWNTGATPGFDRSTNGIWAVTIQVSDWTTVKGCLMEMGGTTQGCLLVFDDLGDLIWRAGESGTPPTNDDNYARCSISNATLSAIDVDTDFTIVFDVRNDGTNSGRVRLWVLHAGGEITATVGETSDASGFTDQVWASYLSGQVGDADILGEKGYINGKNGAVVGGETGSTAIPTDNSVTYSSGVTYWHDLLIGPPFEITGGKLQLSEGMTTASYIYDFDLGATYSGELNYLAHATNISAERLKVYDTQSTSVYDAQSIQITPTSAASPETPLLEFSIDLEKTGTYVPLVTATAKRFDESRIKMTLIREAGSAFRPSVSFLQTTLSN